MFMSTSVQKKISLALCFVIVCLTALQAVAVPKADAAAQTVTMDKPAYIQGKPITLSFTGGTLNDWIGLYPKGAEPKGSNPSLTWGYTKSNPNGKMSFVKTLAPGEYEVLYMENDGYNIFQRVPFSIISLSPPSGVTFHDTDGDGGEVGGEVRIAPPAIAANVTAYNLYWGDDVGKLAGLAPIAVLSPDLGGGSYAVYTFPDNTPIPAGATKLLAYSDSAAGETDSSAEAALPGIVRETPEAQFQVLSDMHVMGDPNHIHNKHLDDTLKDIAELAPDSDGIMTVGDNTENGYEEQYKELARIFDKYKEQLPESYFVEGNHDVRWGDWDIRSDLFEKYTNMTSKYYDVWVKGYHFIFLGTEKGLKDYSYLSDEQLQWLEQKLAEDAAANKPVFVFHHQPLKNTVAGTQVSKNPSFYWYGVRQDRELKTILSKYPQAIMFSGHTHWELGSMDTMYNSKYATMFNTAATSYLWTDGNASKVGNQGYFVEVYDDKVLVKGRDFMNDKWIANAQFEVSLPASIPSVDPEADPDLDLGGPELAMADLTLAPGEAVKVDYRGSVAKDWIGIFREGTKLSNTTAALAKRNTNSSVQPDGSLTFEGLNLAPGRYDAVYVGEADYTTANDNIELGRVTFTVAEEEEPTYTVEVTGEGGAAAITAKDGHLQLNARLAPNAAAEFDWSVTNEDDTATDKASISASGLLTAAKDGKVKATATWKQDRTVQGSVLISISGQTNSGGGNNGGGNEGGNNGGNNGGGNEPQPEQPGVHTVDMDDINQSAGKDTVEIRVTADTKQLVVPTDLASKLNQKGLAVKSDNLQMVIPAEVIRQALLASSGAPNGKLVLDIAPLSESKKNELLEKMNGPKGQAGISLTGDIYDFSFTFVAGNGNTTAIRSFEKPVQIKLKTAAGVNPDVAGIFYIAEDGKLEYAGGKLEGGYMSAEVSHFSQYAVLSLEKTFADVPAAHWAFRSIQSLTAKGIVQGVSETEFRPGRSVTRAEFAALLVRTLNLKDAAELPFEDVAADAWYAESVAAAFKAGIISGKSAVSFDPEGNITREEMVAMAMRAFRTFGEEQAAQPAATPFSDESSISKWALDDVYAAAELGLVQGRGANRFAPQGVTTRAEAAQVIQNVLQHAN
ncbi:MULTISPECIES: S-layer homology domain-containing protein [unclassified Paenibacillus]|uniref:S-layer homology domain-containing protein n=1 Tax=unclassified Paenibacillus TaxID=185978 RepID=UPI0036D3C94A